MSQDNLATEVFELSVAFDGASFSAKGSRAVVLSSYADFKQLLDTAVKPKAATKPIDRESTNEPASTTQLPLKPFLAQLSLKGNKEKVTAVVAWSVASGHDAGLTIDGVEKLWRKTPFKLPGNLARDLRGAEAEGWLEREGKDGSPDARFGISGYGEEAVAGWQNGASD